MEDQNLKELFQKISPADQSFIYDYIIKKLVKNNPQELVIRRSAKISLDGTDEEIKKSISEALKIPINEIDLSSIQKQRNEIKKEYNRTQIIINDYLSFLKKSKASSDKFEELDDIGKFIKKFNPNLILKVPDNLNQVPDFIVKDKNKFIGIEHTRLINPQIQKIIGTLNKIIFNCSTILKNNPTTSNYLINISFNYNQVILNNKTLLDKISQKEIKEIARNISDIIIGYKKSDKYLIPNYINTITFKKIQYETEINLIENYLSKDNYSSLLEEKIDKKESKFKSYLTENKIDEIWLLIINSGIKSSSGFSINKQENIKSKFNKIFIMDNFDYDIKHIS